MSPKTLTGAELQLDDGPARDSELFLVDGNNLAYRAFYALPEELATSEGFSTNALLGFANMLFKLLADYRPKGVAVAWDTRPVHRTELLDTYKIERKPMPDLLREQFPYFRPIVEAFGYRNLEFEGWEADDVIATLAPPRRRGRDQDDRGLDRPRRLPAGERQRRADDDPARRLRRPRLHARARRAAPRDQARAGAGLHRPQGRPSDNIPGVPGIGDKTAGQLIAQYGSLEEVLEHVDELTPARSKSIAEHAEQARRAKELATMRRDLELDFDPAEVVLSPPDRSQLKEMFRRFEFRALLNRVDELDEALPAAALTPDRRRGARGARNLVTVCYLLAAPWGSPPTMGGSPWPQGRRSSSRRGRSASRAS
jgi:DNA polymerase-1